MKENVVGEIWGTLSREEKGEGKMKKIALEQGVQARPARPYYIRNTKVRTLKLREIGA